MNRKLTAEEKAARAAIIEAEKARDAQRFKILSKPIVAKDELVATVGGLAPAIGLGVTPELALEAAKLDWMYFEKHTDGVGEDTDVTYVTTTSPLSLFGGLYFSIGTHDGRSSKSIGDLAGIGFQSYHLYPNAEQFGADVATVKEFLADYAAAMVAPDNRNYAEVAGNLVGTELDVPNGNYAMLMVVTDGKIASVVSLRTSKASAFNSTEDDKAAANEDDKAAANEDNKAAANEDDKAAANEDNKADGKAK